MFDEQHFDGHEECRREIERLTTCLLLAQEVGQDWRNDWSDFDGRTLRDQMNGLSKVADGTVSAEDYRTQWLTCQEDYQ